MKSPDFHTEIIDLIKEDDNKRIAIAAPRGHAKSSLVDLVYLLWVIIHKKAKYVLLISDTYTQATAFMDALKAELEGNEKLRAMYGDMTSKNWSEGEIVANGIKIEALGAGMKVRGKKYREYRPDLIIIDDLENDELVQSKERREKLSRWYSGALEPCLGEGGRIIIIGTILHFDALLYKILDPKQYPEYIKRVYKAIIDEKERKTLWEEHLNYDKILKVKEEYIGRGQLYLFYQEYQNDPISDENRHFRLENFKYFEDSELKDKLLATYITIDRAYSTAKTADYTGIIVNSVDTQNNWYIQKAERFKGKEDKLIDYIFGLVSFFQPVKLGIEQKAFKYTLQVALEDEMRRRNIFFSVVELKDKGTNKNLRIEGLVPRFNTGTIFIKREQTDLIDELTRFPMGDFDDLCLDGETLVATTTGNKKIKDIKKKDNVITPFGIRKVLWSGQTGVKRTINNLGIEGTPNHKIFNGNSFDKLDTIDYNNHISRLNFKENLIWKYKKLLYLMVSPTNLWVGRESIILVNQERIKSEKMLKDFTWRFGNFIIKKKFQKAVLFTIKTVILLIMTLKILSVYWLGNIYRNIIKEMQKILNLLENKKKFLIESDHSQKNGIVLKKVKNGIENTLKNLLRKKKLIMCVPNVEQNIKHSSFKVNFALGNVEIEQVLGNGEKNIQTIIKKVYNITVEDDGVFYANGILVSNCDALAYQLGIADIPSNMMQSNYEEIRELEDLDYSEW